MSTDQNLLFGVLALQADFLDAARFAEACSAWAARKDTPQALDWLRTDLTLWRKRVERGQPGDRAEAHAKVRNWRQDADLAGVRDEKALAALPEAEQIAWRKVWADVAILLARASDR
jgi:hypothetical protein